MKRSDQVVKFHLYKSNFLSWHIECSFTEAGVVLKLMFYFLWVCVEGEFQTDSIFTLLQHLFVVLFSKCNMIC